MMPASGNDVVVLNDEDLVAELPRIRPEVVVASVAAWELLKRNAETLISSGPDAQTVLQPILGHALDLQADVEAGRLGASVATEMSLLTAAFSRLRRKVGLDRVVLAVASGGDLPQLLRRWFGAVGVTLIDDSEFQPAL
jgi:long-subunit acyl-CoA synthetase (AMP-forming)